MAQNPEIPTQIGRYQVVRLIGRGAMGQVLLAHDPVLERPVAVKHLRADLSLTGEQLEALTRRMGQEARASARVSHPNLVALHDMGQDDGVGLFLVFEYVEGSTLRERLERGPLEASEAAELARQLGGALTAAHAAGVVHRDVKPDNVMLAKMGAKIADFGIARLPDSTLTLPGGLLGTPAYGAPEAIDQGSFSPASDQFSLAATLYEAISGRRAFPGDDAVTVAALVQTTEPPPIAALCRLDPRVDTLLARALAKHPASRFDSCESFGSALAEALTAGFRRAMPTQPDALHSLAPPPRRRAAGRLVRAFLLAATAAAGLAMGWMGLPRWLSRAGELAGGGVASLPDGAAQQADPDLHPVAFLAERPRAPRSKPRAVAGARPARRVEPLDGGVRSGQ